MFNGNKLYRVYVFYRDGSTNTLNTLVNVLTNRYGNPTNTYRESGRSLVLSFGASLSYIDHILFSKFSPDIDVELFQEVTNTSILGGLSQTSEGSIEICYTWKRFRDAYEASILDL
jgi:hypothetical protein